MGIIAKRLKVLSWSASTKTKVSVRPCGSVANEKKLSIVHVHLRLIKKILEIPKFLSNKNLV